MAGDIVPFALTRVSALNMVRRLAADSDQIVVLSHAQRRGSERRISRGQIEACLRKGTIIEGPYLNAKGDWQMNFYRHAAGEEITCVVIIDWPKRLLVVTTY